MQIIQGIRDKGAAIVIAVIALSLIGFILMDAKQGSSRLFGSSSENYIAKVNGETIDMMDFSKKVRAQEEQEKQQSQQPITPTRSYQIKDQVWNTMVALKIFYKEASKLGIEFTSLELNGILSSEDPSNPLMQGKDFIDPATGRLDMAKVSQKLKEIKKGTGEARDKNEQMIDYLKQNSIVNKYNGLLAAGAYYPGWMQEKDSTDRRNFALISFVSIPYNVIPDSTIKVTDEEIESYVSKHKKAFKQEEGRMLSYVSFSQLPKAEDSARTKKEVEDLMPKFATDTNMAAFLAQNSSAMKYFDGFVPKSKMSMPAKDSLINLPKDHLFGPYKDAGNYVVAKMIDIKTMPDSIKCRHILIATTDRNTGQPTMPDSVAKQRIDSIEAAIRAGANFDTLEAKYTSDEAAHKDKGVMTFDIATIQNKENFAPEFGDFLLNEKGETKKTVKTSFGWHYIEILEKKNPQPAYKIAYLAKQVIAGENTTTTASAAAIKLSSERNAKNFDVYVAKNQLQKVSLPNLIKESDFTLGAIQDARQLVNWLYDHKEGEVSEPFLIDDQYIVAVVDKIVKEGTQDAKAARPMVERVIKNQKIAAEIIKKTGSSPTLDAAAAAYGKQVQTAGADSSITFVSALVSGLSEPKLVGASFNKEYQSKPSPPIEGTSGVYVLKVNSIGAKNASTPAEAEQNAKNALSTLRSQVMDKWYEGLKNQATVKDNRSKVNY